MFKLGNSTECGQVVVQGAQLKCVICRHDIFWERELQLPTSIFNFLEADDGNGTAHCAVCGRCGYVHMFIPPNTVKDESGSRPEASPAPST